MTREIATPILFSILYSRLLPCIHRFKVTNEGHHFQRLFWTVECHSSPEEGGQGVSALSSPKAEDDCQRPKRSSPVFGLEPPSMELQPGESVDMVLRGFSRITQVRSPPRAEPGQASHPLPWACSTVP